MTIQQAFELALQHHRAGRLAEAEAIYRQILAVAPQHADSLHLLGVIALAVGRPEEALQLISGAIALAPSEPIYYGNLGEVYRRLGRFDEAAECLRRSLALRPDCAEDHNNLGSALAQSGRPEEAVRCFQDAIRLRPDYAEAHNNLGVLRKSGGQLNQAMAAYREAIALKSNFAEAHYNLGIALKETGRLDEAIASFHQAVTLRPGYAEAQSGLGEAFQANGQLSEAIAAYRQAIALTPNLALVHYNLGIALFTAKRPDEAITAYRQAVALNPNFYAAWNNLGTVLHGEGQFAEAIAAYGRAIALDPSLPEGHSNLGNVLRDSGQLDAAIASFHQAIALKPGLPEAHCNLGVALLAKGQLDEAFVSFRQAFALKPSYVEARSDLIASLPYHPGYSDPAIAEEKRLWNQQHAEPLRRFIPVHVNERLPDRRLRIGYVSPDFREHVVGRNVLPLLAGHDRSQVEIFCYSDVPKPDEMTARFHALADHWRDTSGMGDQEVAELIGNDVVDILVDLSQHGAANRLLVFARKPAPVQASFAGYPAGTGVEAIEYRISDPYLEAYASEMGDERFARRSEIEDGRSGKWSGAELRTPNSHLPPWERVFLIDSFWCYDPCGMEAAVNELPAKESGRITFGSLNHFCKINAVVLQLWARVLARVRDSRLVLLSPPGDHRQKLLEFLERQGVAAERIEFVESRPRREYLDLYHRLDIVLDPFPYNGHTTSLDALWMGVPLVSLKGKTAVGRGGWSVLSNVGLPELVADSEDEYLRIATELAGDLPRLSSLRATLRKRMEDSVLMDGPRFARGVEAAYRSMWRGWCAESL